MQCPECQFDNPDEAKFCNECGCSQKRSCPSCNNLNLPASKFCNECGTKLITTDEAMPKEMSFDEKLNKIQRYLPKGVTEKILAQRGRIEGEHKHITVLFCDIVNFTPLVENLGHESAFHLMDQVYEILIHKIHEYGGTVNEMTGDGVMALFGAPIALEDAPQRAIRSGIAIHRAITSLKNDPKDSCARFPSLKMRIGINTGPVVVGTLGNDLRVEFKAVGETVNLASRMEGLADPGTIYVTEETFKHTEGFFRFEALGKKHIKGLKEFVNVFRVIDTSSRRTRFDVSAEKGLTPFVGRGRELELLLDGFERTKRGSGQAFSIISEAGLGKSRLLYEFRKAVANENITFLEGKCLSYSRSNAYHPVVDILKSNFDIDEDDADKDILRKIEYGLVRMSVNDTTTLPFLLELLTASGNLQDKYQLTPEAIKTGISKSLRKIIMKGSITRPLILAFEDLHWVDNSSEELIAEILDHIPMLRVMLIFTYRPEFSFFSKEKSYHSKLNLIRLSNRESESLIVHLLDKSTIDSSLLDLIIDKTEGVPFFIEEFIESYKNLNIIKKRSGKYDLAYDLEKVSIPTTVQDIIMARVDRLISGAKEILQIGSVIEREFSYAIIKEMTNLSEQDLLSHLRILKDAELLYETGIFPDSVYIFKHSLTRETVYNTLLHKRKIKIHRAIGRSIEKLYASKLEDYFGAIAHHSLNGEDWERALKYNKEAGLRAHALSAYEEELRYFTASIKALQNMPRNRDRIVEEIDLRFNMRSALFPLGRHNEWANQIKKAATLSDEIGDRTRLANCYNYLSTHYWLRGKHRKAINLCENALKLSEETGDFPVYITSKFHLGIPLMYTGQFGRQVELHREIAKNLSGKNVFKRYGLASIPSVLSRAYLAWGLAELGEFQEAEKWALEGVEISNQAKNIFSSSWVRTCLGTVYLLHGKLDVAKEVLEQALALCRDADTRTVFSFIAASLGHVYCLRGKSGEAIQILEEAIESQESNLSAVPKSYSLSALAVAYHANGQVEDSTYYFNQAIEVSQENEEHGFQAWTDYFLGIIHAQGTRDQLNHAIKSLIEIKTRAKNLSMKPLLANIHSGLGQTYLKIGKASEAIEEIHVAMDLYKEMRNKLGIKKVESVLSKIGKSL